MKYKYLTLIVIHNGQLLTIMDIFIINVSIPSIQRDLRASNGAMQFMIAAYLIGFASFLITGGRLGIYTAGKRSSFQGYYSLCLVPWLVEFLRELFSW